ncbi:hypothetical protein cyc_01780 [Cyclospora cayetanensis]|uniref:Uncharacterized protein n=1 Tax=Cyclospora cayetanensis TaxID=88456 RepID=A0A1D3D129_9EIME|nr:hypothetical protein cyc_01780 [Cyclospora cayetanensis]
MGVLGAPPRKGRQLLRRLRLRQQNARVDCCSRFSSKHGISASVSPEDASRTEGRRGSSRNLLKPVSLSEEMQQLGDKKRAKGPLTRVPPPQKGGRMPARGSGKGSRLSPLRGPLKHHLHCKAKAP